ncbi:DUF2868 domain-containing protein [Aliikangiella sp. IMCC44359]|uniref:DUF2868 domain-containing protein n=1 Tax=Aliikangiella sp. IMCC44359 TaxID=3459125 RepID=UPI00403A7F3E
MQLNSNSPNINLKTVWPITLTGAGLGFLIAWSVLSGDQQGKVNLSYLLLVYLFIPVLSLIISSVSLFKGKGVNLARLVTFLPIWSEKKKALMRKVHQLKVEKYWLFFQSQLAGIAFSVASLLVFLILLLITDISFIWRSTLLDAADLYPLLKVLAFPWRFWHEAQPSLDLLKATQDSRLIDNYQSLGDYSGWWQFVLAVQIFYSILLRGLLLLLASVWFKKRLANDIESQLSESLRQHAKQTFNEVGLSPVVAKLPAELKVNNWAGIEKGLLQQAVANINISPDNMLNAGPLASEAEQRIAERWQGPQLVLVKSWEPPMGELEDFLINGQGFLLPLDWNQSGLQPLQIEHLEEWQRFTNQLAQWQVYLPEKLMPRVSYE